MPRKDGNVEQQAVVVPEITTTPSTPQRRGRESSRYPASLALEPGRVPLHRRGTSKTYERLEDLLREAGYKETRIFTPEAERFDRTAEQTRRGSVREGVDAVVGFLAGWMPGAVRSEGTSEDEREGSQELVVPPVGRPTWSTPPSPLGHKRSARRPRTGDSTSLSLSPSPSSATLASSFSHHSGSPRSRIVAHRRDTHSPHQPLRARTSAAESLRTFAQVSAARNHLRHMASAPNMPRRLPYAHDTPEQGGLQPPLPSRWLETVAKAVLGVEGAHVGGPAFSRAPSHRSQRPPSSRGRKFLMVEDAYAARAHSVARSASGAPPGLTSYLRPGGTVPGAVSTVQVVCRSAPASRSSSQVGERSAFVSLKGGAPLSRRTSTTKPGSRSKTNRVLTLASTLVQDDVWGHQWIDGQRMVVSAQDDRRSTTDTEDTMDIEDDDDDELDLARILVPPKRQYSIQSLRKHLHSTRRLVSGSGQPWEDDDGVSARGRARRGSMDEGHDHTHGWETLGVPKNTNKRRSGIPGGWAGRQ